MPCCWRQNAISHPRSSLTIRDDLADHSSSNTTSEYRWFFKSMVIIMCSVQQFVRFPKGSIIRISTTFAYASVVDTSFHGLCARHLDPFLCKHAYRNAKISLREAVHSLPECVGFEYATGPFNLELDPIIVCHRSSLIAPT